MNLKHCDKTLPRMSYLYTLLVHAWLKCAEYFMTNLSARAKHTATQRPMAHLGSFINPN